MIAGGREGGDGGDMKKYALHLITTAHLTD
jgi:hypothetical protein